MSRKEEKNRVSRRKFLSGSALAAAAISIGGPLKRGTAAPVPAQKKFNLSFAPHFGMFKNSAGEDKIDQLKFMADQGFHAFEHNGMKNETVEMQEKIATTMTQLNIKMGVFVASSINWKEPTLTTGDKTIQDEFVKQIKESVEVAKRVNAKWMTVVPGHLDLRKDLGYQTVNVIEALKRASEVFEPQGMVMVLEPLNFYNHPGLFLTKAAQAYKICKSVNSPACKILFDIYHQQIQEGNLIPNINHAWSEIGYFQIGDNPGRKEPTTGEINYKNVFQHIHEKGFDGIYGMEHGNSKKGKEGEEALLKAYRTVDVEV
jgi:hydroxypyruvate isomerase